MFFTLLIPAGTIVLSKRGTVKLVASVDIFHATRDADGAFRYTLGTNEYVVSAGCCKFAPEAIEGWTHKNGLVAHR